jgi:UDP:flavonoid glycosyltransferase YjiC (YdhE family)
MTTSKKIILFFPFNLLSHYLRCIVLAKTYDANTHTIYFISSDEYNHFVLKNGYQVFHAKQFNATSVMQCSRNFDFSWLNHHDLEEVMLDQIRVIRNLKASLVIGDMAPSLKMAATLTAVHHISLLNAYMTPYYDHTRKLSRRHMAYPLMRVLPETVQDIFTTLGEKLAFQRIQKNFNHVRKKHGLTPIDDYLHENEGDETFICDSPTVFPLKSLPKNYKVIGPLFYDTPAMAEQPLDEAIGERQVICVCMGSTGDWESLRFLNDAYYAKYAVVTTGDTKQVLSASHIIPFTFLNLDQLLQKCFLMICHGGNGTIYTGIKNEVFMLCLPSHFEQEWNITALEKTGRGQSADQLTPSQWKIEINKHAVSTAMMVLNL